MEYFADCSPYEGLSASDIGEFNGPIPFGDGDCLTSGPRPPSLINPFERRFAIRTLVDCEDTYEFFCRQDGL